MTPFELSLLGGPWGRRLDPRRAWIDALPWDEPLADRPLAEAARTVWTRTAFSEYASAAAFAELARRLLAAGAPIDVVAAAGDFVVDEVVHTQAAARIAGALGGAVELEVDYAKLVRPALSDDPLVGALELAVRTSCVGEAMTVPMLKLGRELSGSALMETALANILADEGQHAQLGWWLLDWAMPALTDAEREHLGAVAGQALASFASLRGAGSDASGLGVVGAAPYDAMLAQAATHHVARPLAERGIVVPAQILEAFQRV